MAAQIKTYNKNINAQFNFENTKHKEKTNKTVKTHIKHIHYSIVGLSTHSKYIN